VDILAVLVGLGSAANSGEGAVIALVYFHNSQKAGKIWKIILVDEKIV